MDLLQSANEWWTEGKRVKNVSGDWRFQGKTIKSLKFVTNDGRVTTANVWH